MTELIKVRVKYRLAKLVCKADPEKLAEAETHTLEYKIRALLAGQLGQNVIERVIKFTEDGRHSLCLHVSQLNEGALAFDLLHMDDRTEVTTWIRPTSAVPISSLGETKIAADEVNLQEPAYLMISGNHLAVIERIGLRTSTIENYLNDILKKAGLIDDTKFFWRLIPRIEAIGVSALRGGVEKIVLKPRAALVGEGETSLAQDAIKHRRYNRKIDEFIGYGEKILSMLKILGAYDADIETLRAKMSSDLVLKARVEISVSRAERGSEAKISADDISTAFAHVTETSDIQVVDKDGRTNGKLTQLSHEVEVTHKNGIIDISHAVSALGAAINSWVAKGAIEL
jgi:hypothetical protein